VKSGNNFEYLISAKFTENALLFRNGVLYPSVKAEGTGINVALEPNFVDNYMKLVRVWECFLYKKDEKIKIGKGSDIILEEGQTEFTL
jgi:hypothetical protein